MKKEDIKQAIYQKYIVPTKRRARDYVGVEFELPIVNLNRQPVDFEVVHKLAESFVDKYDFTDHSLDDDGNIYAATSRKNGDTLSFDCSYNTLELSFGTESDLNILSERFKDYYTFIQDYLLPHGHTLTGMGINPNRTYNNNIPIPNERYRMLFHHLESYELYGSGFHDYPNFGLFSAANQVQLDVEEDKIADVLNTFNKLEPLKSILFANSILDNYLCSRDFLWKKSLHGLNPNNVDGYDRTLKGVDDVIDYIEEMSIYCVIRDGRYINFMPTPLDVYFTSERITGECWNGHAYETATFVPEISDLEYLRSFKFEDLTFRGTVEFRSVCSQPVSEIMTSPAFHTGLINKVNQLNELLKNDNIVYNNILSDEELREAFNLGKRPDYINDVGLRSLLYKVLDLSVEGLKERGRGEEHFIYPLYYRTDRLLSPAKQMKDGLENGVPVEYFIKEYAAL